MCGDESGEDAVVSSVCIGHVMRLFEMHRYKCDAARAGLISSRVKHLNVSGRRPGGSELIALDMDDPGVDGLYNLRAIKPLGYTGAKGEGDEELDLLGFDAEILDGDTIEFTFVNERPPVGAFNNYLDASVLGANSTIDVFELKRGSDSMRHVRTIWSSNVPTPNRVAALGNGEFVVTNDHSTKTGLVSVHKSQSACVASNIQQRMELDPIIGGGNVAFCNVNGECHTAVSGDEPDEELPAHLRQPEPLFKEYLNKARALLPKPKLKFPNGLTRGFDNLIYLPSSIDGRIRVYAVTKNNMLRLVDTIHTGYPLDNISPDARGDLYVAAFPNILNAIKSMADPFNLDLGAPATVLRIRKTVDMERKKVDYRVEKVLEDRDAKVLSGSTTVRHDVKTGNLWIGGKLL